MYPTFLNFLISPLGLVTLLLVFFVFPLVVFFQREKKRHGALLTAFDASYSWRYGLRINFNGKIFRFSAYGRSRGSVEYGGIVTRPMLWGYVEAPNNFFCAEGNIEKYEFSWNLGKAAFQRRMVAGEKEIIIGSESEVFLLQLEKLLKEDSDSLMALARLLALPASYLSVKRETHVGRAAVFSTEQTFRYFGFPDTVHIDPSILEQSMKTIALLFERFGIHLERSTEEANAVKDKNISTLLS